MRKLVIIPLFLTVFALQAQTLDPYSPPAVLEFADYLYDRGQTQEALWEYERYLFLSQNSNMPVIKKMIALYQQDKRYQEILSLLENSSLTGLNPEEKPYLMAQKGHALFLLEENEVLKKFLSETKGSSLWRPEEFTSLATAQSLYLGDYENARTWLDELETTAALPPVFEQLNKDLKHLKIKKPAAAVLLSALIPGLGKAYLGQWGDALFSLVTVGTLGTLSGFAFQQEGLQSWRPWVYSTTAAVFYSANIYGSYSATIRYNDTQLRHLQEEANKIREFYYEN